jgi:hypothetical protein
MRACFRAMRAEQAVERAIGEGKILPAQREFYGKIALTDLPAFEKFVKDAPKQVDTTEHGLGGGADAASIDEFDKVEKLVLSEVEKKMKAQSGLQYHEALKTVAVENPALNRKYTELSRKRMGGRD